MSRVELSDPPGRLEDHRVPLDQATLVPERGRGRIPRGPAPGQPWPTSRAGRRRGRRSPARTRSRARGSAGIGSWGTDSPGLADHGSGKSSIVTPGRCRRSRTTPQRDVTVVSPGRGVIQPGVDGDADAALGGPGRRRSGRRPEPRPGAMPRPADPVPPPPNPAPVRPSASPDDRALSDRLCSTRTRTRPSPTGCGTTARRVRRHSDRHQAHDVTVPLDRRGSNLDRAVGGELAERPHRRRPRTRGRAPPPVGPSEPRV